MITLNSEEYPKSVEDNTPFDDGPSESFLYNTALDFKSSVPNSWHNMWMFYDAERNLQSYISKEKKQIDTQNDKFKIQDHDQDGQHNWRRQAGEGQTVVHDSNPSLQDDSQILQPKLESVSTTSASPYRPSTQSSWVILKVWLSPMFVDQCCFPCCLKINTLFTNFFFCF